VVKIITIKQYSYKIRTFIEDQNQNQNHQLSFTKSNLHLNIGKSDYINIGKCFYLFILF